DAAATVSDAELESLALAGVEADLCQLITSTASDSVLEPDEELTRRHRRAGHGRRMLRSVGALAAAVVLIVVALLVLQARSSKVGSAWAARAVKVAEASPRVLVIGGGWGVTDVSGFDEEYGELTFRDGPARVELSWQLAKFVNDRAQDGVSLGTMRVAGHDAQLFDESQAGAPTGLFNVLWKSCDHSVKLLVS